MGTGEDETCVTDTTDRIVDEHAKIREMMRRLEGVTDLEELQRQLQALRAMLVPHFAHEEAPDGFFDLLREAASRHLVDIQRFEQEHGQLLADIDALIESARACLAGPVAQIVSRCGELARRVRRHESRESALLVDALYVDVGGQ